MVDVGPWFTCGEGCCCVDFACVPQHSFVGYLFVVWPLVVAFDAEVGGCGDDGEVWGGSGVVCDVEPFGAVAFVDVAAVGYYVVSVVECVADVVV